MKTIAQNAVSTSNANQETKSMKKTAKKSATNTSNATANQETKSMKKIAKKSATSNLETVTASDTLVATSSSAPEVAAASPPTTAPTGSVAARLQALEQTCGYGDPLPDDVRLASDSLVRHVPSSIVDRVIALAVRGGGTVAGIKLDPDAAKAALAAADDAETVATAGQMLVRRAQDQAIRLRAGVTGDVSAIRTALRGYVKTAQGKPLASENDELRSLAKQHVAARKARNTRTANAVDAAKAAAAAPETPTVAPVATPTPTAPKAS